MTNSLLSHAVPGGDFTLSLLAPAKINLALHVVGQRADGYHMLESLVTFADHGDRLFLSPADADHFTLSGPFAACVPDVAHGTQGNLVLRARDRLRRALQACGFPCGPVHLHLEKNLPVASGIGGGSADAASALKGLVRLWDAEAAPLDLPALGLTLGADLPMCLAGAPLLARGIGEAIASVPALPAFPALLVNPGIAVSTPAVFSALPTKTNPPLVLPPRLPGTTDWLAAPGALRNDLEPPARLLAPMIGEVTASIGRTGALLTRMSGSGATCFGLYGSADARDRAASAISAARPDWYVLACTTIGTSGDDHDHA